MRKSDLFAQDVRALCDDELARVIGGTTISPGYGPARLNLSPFSFTAPFDSMWELVGRTGHLPVPG